PGFLSAPRIGNAGRAPLASSVADHLYERGAALLRGRDLVRKGDAGAVEALAAPQAHPEAQTVHGEHGRLFGGCIGMGASLADRRMAKQLSPKVRRCLHGLEA